jgi:hypothetical protein
MQSSNEREQPEMKTNRERKPKANWTTAFPKQLRQSPQRTRNQTQKPWRGIRTVSKSRAPELREYRKRKAVFLFERRNWVCPVAAYCGHTDKVTEVHHVRGRNHKLLNDERYWLGVSAKGHRRIHDNPGEAQRHGWLASAGQWGKAD